MDRSNGSSVSTPGTPPALGLRLTLRGLLAGSGPDEGSVAPREAGESFGQPIVAKSHPASATSSFQSCPSPVHAVHLCFGTDAMQAGFLPTQPTTSILPCIPSADNTRFSVGGWVFNQGDVTLSAHGIK